MGWQYRASHTCFSSETASNRKRSLVSARTAPDGSDPLAYAIAVALGRVTAHQLGGETRGEQLHADDHRSERDIEKRLAADERRRLVVREVIKLHTHDPGRGQETQQEGEGAQRAEEMHRLAAEAEDEGDREQIKEAIDEPVHAEFGPAVL